jgi:hypothetical protein
VLQLAEEALDEVALTVECRVDGSLDLAVAGCRDVGLAAGLAHQIEDGLGIIAAIGDEGPSGRQASEQFRADCLVGGLARRDDEADGQTLLVNDGMDLGRQSPTRTADGVIRAPFFPPAACWWARTMEESIRCSDWGDLAANSSKTLSQTPCLAHRLKRL